METNSEKMIMDPTESLEQFMRSSKKEVELSKKPSEKTDIIMDDDDDDDDYFIEYKEGNNNAVVNDYDSDWDSVSDDSNDENNEMDEKKKRYNSLREKMAPFLANKPRLEKICEDLDNTFLSSHFESFTFQSNENDSVNELHQKASDLKYLLNLHGTKLRRLSVKKYPFSQIMPIINAYCPNLEMLSTVFKEITSQDFENVFSNMSHLKHLSIDWQCKNSTLPVTLAESLEQISGVLGILNLSCTCKRNDMFSPDSLALIFPRLVALKTLHIYSFGLSQLLLQSIGEIKNLTHLRLNSRWPKNHPMFDARINMDPIGYLNNLENVSIHCDYGITDKFLINLGNHAKKLRVLSIIGKDITDIGMSAINNLEQLEYFDLGLTVCDSFENDKNEFITDVSIQRLFNQKLTYLNISNCINVTDESVTKLVENLPNLRRLQIGNTKVTLTAVKKIYKLKKSCGKVIRISN